jgi:hypothetical protein
VRTEAVLAIACGIVLFGFGVKETLGPDTPDGTDVTYTADCDYVLDFDAGHQLVATAFVSNNSDGPVKVDVVATWRQAGNPPITVSRTLTLAEDRTDVEVHLNSPATDTEIELLQVLDNADQCTVTATLK